MNFKEMVAELLPFGIKLKKRLLDLKKLDKTVRVECPNKAHTDTKYIYARLLPNRRDKSGYHLHFRCEDEKCYYNWME